MSQDNSPDDNDFEEVDETDTVKPGPPVSGADIFCIRCGARPFGAAWNAREDFDLMKLNDKGNPAGEGEGAWLCSLHFRRLGRDRYALVDLI